MLGVLPEVVEMALVLIVANDELTDIEDVVAESAAALTMNMALEIWAVVWLGAKPACMKRKTQFVTMLTSLDGSCTVQETDLV